MKMTCLMPLLALALASAACDDDDVNGRDGGARDAGRDSAGGTGGTGGTGGAGGGGGADAAGTDAARDAAGADAGDAGRVDAAAGDASSIDALSSGDVARYALTLNLTGFTSLANQKLTVYVVETPSMRLVTTREVAMLMASQTVMIDSVLEAGKTYNVDFWVDENANGTCQPSDRGWRLAVTTPVIGTLALSQPYDANAAMNVCR